MTDLTQELKLLNIDLPKLLVDAIKKIEVLFQAGHIKETEVLIKQLLKVDPQNIQGLQLYGLLLYRNKKYKESIKFINDAIKLDPKNAENYNNVALSYLHSGQTKLALEAIEKAVELNSENCVFLNNSALIFRALGDLDKSIKTYEKSINLDSNNPQTWESLGSVYGQEKKLNKAIECFQKSIELDPSVLGAHVDLAYAYHLQGDWEKAWPEYEYRLEYWHKEGRNPGRFYEIYKPEKNWDGKVSLNNKSIVVYCEQGAGDMIQFIRFVPKLKELGAKVYIDAPVHLATLFDEFGEIRTAIGDENYDYHCSILSLPYLLNCMTPEKYEPEAYLVSENFLNMSDYKDTFNIGICWAGNPGHPNDANRSCHLSYFRDISNIAGVKLFSLQKDVGKRVYANFPDVEIDLTSDCQDIKIVDTSDLMTDYQATASIINSLDLVITVDTSILHLAGALGKETWGLIPFNPDWRWTYEGESTVWYDSVKLYRQPEAYNWKSVFELITNKLKEKVNESILSNQ